ncbi:tetratricopeptide repeat protein [Anthocerotibacter panamensis]|uniref:tetratricopeptide repeat protein n=1 Tax=Anthocerotibacter panamensis TaxID=2857077 RepID=UPI001C401D1E|nr:tetratricopeptide repeat protein [Anthocerotibacter panamensis]
MTQKRYAAIIFLGGVLLLSSALLSPADAQLVSTPIDSTLLVQQGTDRFDRKDYQGAIEAYTQALSLNPNNALAYYNRGSARAISLQDYTGAIADYTRALRLNPSMAEAHYNMASAHLALGDRQAALQNLKRAAEIFQAQGKRDLSQLAQEKAQELQPADQPLSRPG